MATKAPTKKREKVIHVEAPEGASDLEVMHPERVLVIGGDTITMREYGFVEGLSLLPKLQSFIDDLSELLLSDRLASVDGILPLIARHHEVLLEAVATACDQPLSWVQSLNMQDGYSLTAVWWDVNGPFFMRTAMNLVRDSKFMERVRAGQISTPSSSAQATEQPTT